MPGVRARHQCQGLEPGISARVSARGYSQASVQTISSRGHCRACVNHQFQGSVSGNSARGHGQPSVPRVGVNHQCQGSGPTISAKDQGQPSEARVRAWCHRQPSVLRVRQAPGAGVMDHQESQGEGRGPPKQEDQKVVFTAGITHRGALKAPSPHMTGQAGRRWAPDRKHHEVTDL